MVIKVIIIPQLSDNYSYLIHNNKTAIVVDPSEANPVLESLTNNKLKLEYILNTHHHDDHIGGNSELKQKTGANIICSEYDKNRIKADIGWQDGLHELMGIQIQALHTPGHTNGHMCYYIPSLPAVFTGDCLFSLGCGRLFEGNPDQMCESLSKLAALPKNTMVMCGHEYAQKNSKFALLFEPKNSFLDFYSWIISTSLADNKPMVPSTIEIELKANPFLRLNSKSIRKHLTMSQSPNVEVFSKLRSLKDAF